MENLLIFEYVIAAIIRYWLSISDYKSVITDRVEISTPLNSWKRVTEGTALYNEGTDPYLGDLLHETPLGLVAYNWLIKCLNANIILAFIGCDLITSQLLYLTTKNFINHLLARQKKDEHSYAKVSPQLLVSTEDVQMAPVFAASAYLFNPYVVLSCAAQTTTVFANFFLALTFYSMLKGNVIMCTLALALSAQQSLYTIVLIVPVCMFIAQNKNNKVLHIVTTCACFAAMLLAVVYGSYCITNSWSFIYSTYGFIAVNFRTTTAICLDLLWGPFLFLLKYLPQNWVILEEIQIFQLYLLCIFLGPILFFVFILTRLSNILVVSFTVVYHSQMLTVDIISPNQNLTVPDLRPNIGLFWYFFTEMFEHFRVLFLCAFQMNASILYLGPLAFRLHSEPMLLATSLTTLIAVFKSYPSLGDVGFYLALLPMWKHLFHYMQQGFIVSCFFIITLVLGPTFWHLWIYNRSANANFYFGVTLAFATAQIFLVTDLLFAYIKREYALMHGLPRTIDGKEAKLVLESAAYD